MKQTSATEAILLFRKKLEFFVDPFYDAISSLGNGIVSTYKSCKEIVRGTFEQKNNSQTSLAEQPKVFFGENAQKIADLYEDNFTSKGLTAPDEDKKLIYDNALHLYEKIGEGSEDQKERKLITLLHRHRVASINNILKDDDKNEEEKLRDINKILNDSNYGFNHSLDYNIFWLAHNINKSTFLLGDQSNISEKTSEEELFFRLNDFEYSCRGVLASGAKKSAKIEALKTLCQEESTTDYAKKYSTTKINIQDKIEKGARVVEAELVGIEFEANKTILANQEEETSDIRQQIISSLLGYKFETIKSRVAKKIKEDEFIGPKSKDRLTLKGKPKAILPELDHINQPQKQLALKESREQIEVVKQYAENIAKWGISEGRNKMPNKLTDIKISKNVAGAIRTAMYNEAFIKISFAKGRELVEKVRNITGDDVTPPPSSEIQPRAQLTEPPIPAPTR